MSDAGKSPPSPPDFDGNTLISGTGAAQPISPAPALSEARPLPVVERQAYAVEGTFARGGIGRILRARDQRLGRPVALKELLNPGGPDEGRFLNEALVTARLQHPGIVPIYEAGRWSSGEPFYAMRLVSGRSFDERLQETKSFAERLALLPHVLAVAEAVAYAHSQRIIHRDLKPANVLVGEFGETVVIDWGLAKQLTDGPEPATDTAREQAYSSRADTPVMTADDPNHTQAGLVLGTPAYMPPEQAAGRPVDERVDVYALGAILYHLLSGTRPYGKGNAHEVLNRVIAGPPAAIERLVTGVPEELLAIVTQAMARDPAGRYPTAQAMAEDLRRFLTGQLVGAHHYSRVDLLKRFARRNRAVLAVAGIALAALGTVGTVSVRRIMAERDRAELKQAEAEAASREATLRADQLTLVEARTAVERFPNKALEWLGTLSPAFAQWGSARVIAADAQARGLARLLRGHTKGVNFVTFSADGRWLATVSDDRTVRLWNAQSGESKVLGSHDDEAWRAAFSPDSQWLATTSKDRTLRLWDVKAGGSRVLQGHAAPLMGVVFSQDSRRVFTSSMDGEVWRWDVASAEREGYPHFMIKEIHEQPEVVRQCLLGRLTPDGGVQLDGTFSDAVWNDIDRVNIIACGTAYHAGLMGKHLFEKLLRLPTDVYYSSEFRYGDPVLSERSLAIFVSQSGETADTLAALRLCKQRRIRTLGIVNVVGSSIARECDRNLPTQAGPEISVASTKAYTAQVTVLTLLALHIAQVREAPGIRVDEWVDSLRRLPDLVRETLETEEQVKALAEELRESKMACFLGRGADAFVSYEAALKLKEIAYIPTQESPAGELKHGPLALVEPGVVAVFGATQSAVFEKTVSNMQEVRARGGKVLAVTSDATGAVSHAADAVVQIPTSGYEFLDALLSIVPLQLLAYYAAVARGCEVDQPRNLAKSVTVE